MIKVVIHRQFCRGIQGKLTMVDILNQQFLWERLIPRWTVMPLLSNTRRTYIWRQMKWNLMWRCLIKTRARSANSICGDSPMKTDPTVSEGKVRRLICNVTKVIRSDTMHKASVKLVKMPKEIWVCEPLVASDASLVDSRWSYRISATIHVRSPAILIYVATASPATSAEISSMRAS